VEVVFVVAPMFVPCVEVRHVADHCGAGPAGAQLCVEQEQPIADQ